jgi:hypothetical protein
VEIEEQHSDPEKPPIVVKGLVQDWDRLAALLSRCFSDGLRAQPEGSFYVFYVFMRMSSFKPFL